MPENINTILKNFEAISLQELNQVSLMQRVDTKYILHINLVPGILKEILPYQFVLDIDQQRNFSYLTNYYDTKDFKFYNHHHNGYVNRLKVRTRSYVDTDVIFYEIKHKEFGTRTNKIRKEIDVVPDALGEDEYQMIENKRYHGEQLELKMSNSFNRITLCNKRFTERITIDTNIHFFNGTQDVYLPYLSIIEVKQSKSDHFSKTVQVLKQHRIQPEGFSKYAIGIAMLESNVKKNNFKATLLKLNKLANAG